MTQEQILQNTVAITKYAKDINSNFSIKSTETFSITYLKGDGDFKSFNIVVNNYITRQKIKFSQKGTIPVKSIILQAISDYVNGDIVGLTAKKHLKNTEGPKQVRNWFKKYVLPVKQEKSRDILTKYNLIK